MAWYHTLKRRWRTVLTVLTFVALGVFVIALRDQISDTISNLGRIHNWVLLFILLWQTSNFYAYTKMYQSFFALLGHTVPFKQMLRTVFELSFVNLVFPSGGVSGFSYFGLKMKELGVRGSQATLVQMMRFCFVFISFQILLFMGLLILAAGGQASNLTVLIAGSIATLVAIGSIAIVFIMGSKKRINAFFTYITQGLNRIIQLFRPRKPETINIARVQAIFTDLHNNFMVFKKDPRKLAEPLKWALLINLGEILTLYTVYVAFDQWVNPGAVILAYAIANFAGLVSVLPGGIGIYEALMTAVLATAGVSPAVSLPVTVMYRILVISLQVPVGYYFYHQTLHGRPSEQ